MPRSAPRRRPETPVRSRVKVLVVGSGGREHALAWALARSARLTSSMRRPATPASPSSRTAIRCAPRTGLDRPLATRAARRPRRRRPGGAARRRARRRAAARGIAVFGPGAAAARIEGSKAFAKDVMDAAGVPTAQTLAGRAAAVRRQGGRARRGQGRLGLPHAGRSSTRRSRAARRSAAVPRRGAARGPEVSVFALGAGENAMPCRAARGLQADRRRRQRPEHGRHGLVLAGAGRADDAKWRRSSRRSHRPVLRELAQRGTPFAASSSRA